MIRNPSVNNRPSECAARARRQAVADDERAKNERRRRRHPFNSKKGKGKEIAAPARARGTAAQAGAANCFQIIGGVGALPAIIPKTACSFRGMVTATVTITAESA